MRSPNFQLSGSTHSDYRVPADTIAVQSWIINALTRHSMVNERVNACLPRGCLPTTTPASPSGRVASVRPFYAALMALHCLSHTNTGVGGTGLQRHTLKARPACTRPLKMSRSWPFSPTPRYWLHPSPPHPTSTTTNMRKGWSFCRSKNDHDANSFR
jgi:hypothetical protein